mmetsp:Transcript_11353/g.26182  ORF Transcript_11353/g.26182 Transcript_11353/m.26182 type:complete len:455 (+) Transcript_11353:88-1452(+)|eukprot:CAMPEP_0178426350 /NCGR_PEP_ID=MMETSP0689_2-20121128/29190_1 /TAXON_ID=160604 /ORGANISM="Amphidinium massartii, Strain CS-259" /LENGTH=454 /DNA_ID=CAMNT_0020048035 /DNA_START=30 /DNA_END=1394 /DNA_ORIENTATION=-
MLAAPPEKHSGAWPRVVSLLAAFALSAAISVWAHARGESESSGQQRRLQQLQQPEREQPKQQEQVAYGTPDAPFAETALEFKYMVKEIVKAQGGFASKPQLGRYTEADVGDMMRAVRASHDINEGFWRRSGKTSLNHGIGTGSCMLMSGAPAAYVSVAILHGAYFSYWKAYELAKPTHPAWSEDVCPRRRFLQKQVSVASERALWRYYTVYSGNPQPQDPALWHKLFDNNTLASMDKHFLLFDICDDVEQFQHDEQLLTNNDKNHNEVFKAKLLSFIDRLAAEPDMKHLKLGLLKRFTQKVYAQAEDWYFTNPAKYEEDFRIRESLELAFRNGGDEVKIGFAHVEHVRHSILWCRMPINFDKCMQHWPDLINYWEEACCGRGGPCIPHGGEKWRKTLPLKELGLPETWPDKLGPHLTPATVHRTPESFRHDVDRFRGDIQAVRKDRRQEHRGFT